MTRMTGRDCAVMGKLINTHTHTIHTHTLHTHTHTHRATKKQGGEHKVLRAQVRFVQVERVCPLCRV